MADFETNFIKHPESFLKNVFTYLNISKAESKSISVPGIGMAPCILEV